MLYYFSLIGMGIRTSMSNRGAFLFQSVLMLLNNFIFFLIWFFFFRKFTSVNGWVFNDMVLLTAIGTGAYGIMQVCFGGVHMLGRTIIEGELDPYMTQPKNLLLQVLGSTSRTKGWSHMVTPILLLPLMKGLTFTSFTLLFVGIICSAAVFTSVGIIAHSLVFWLGAVHTVSKRYCDSLFVFIMYPTNIYKGLMQIVMFTLIPAGVIGYIPVEVMREFAPWKLLWMLGSASLFVALAILVFYRGLRRYESGNRFVSNF